MKRQRGQAMVEFSLAIMVFLVLLMGVVDFGLGIYKYNGVSQAAREIARVASVHQGPTLGTSTQINAVVATQQKLIPGLGTPTFACTEVNGTARALSGGKCPSDAFINVTITAPYKASTPVLGLVGTFTMKGSSSVQVQH